jgi:hypothetical protein
MKRKTQKEKKNVQQGGWRGRRRETRRFSLLLKLARLRRFQREKRGFREMRLEKESDLEEKI